MKNIQISSILFQVNDNSITDSVHHLSGQCSDHSSRARSGSGQWVRPMGQANALTVHHGPWWTSFHIWRMAAAHPHYPGYPGAPAAQMNQAQYAQYYAQYQQYSQYMAQYQQYAAAQQQQQQQAAHAAAAANSAAVNVTDCTAPSATVSTPVKQYQPHTVQISGLDRTKPPNIKEITDKFATVGSIIKDRYVTRNPSRLQKQVPHQDLPPRHRVTNMEGTDTGTASVRRTLQDYKITRLLPLWRLHLLFTKVVYLSGMAAAHPHYPGYPGAPAAQMNQAQYAQYYAQYQQYSQYMAQYQQYAAAQQQQQQQAAHAAAAANSAAVNVTDCTAPSATVSTPVKQYQPHTVQISGLDRTKPPNIKEITDKFATVGSIIKDRYGQSSVKCRPMEGVVTVEYETTSSAESAIKWFNESEMNGVNIKVEIAPLSNPNVSDKKSQPVAETGPTSGPPTSAPGYQHGPPGGYNRGFHHQGPRHPYNPRYPHPMGGMGGGRPPRTGDWDCNKCGNNNFHFRTECRRCLRPRSLSDRTHGGPGFQPRGGYFGGHRPYRPMYHVPPRDGGVKRKTEEEEGKESKEAKTEETTETKTEATATEESAAADSKQETAEVKEGVKEEQIDSTESNQEEEGASQVTEESVKQESNEAAVSEEPDSVPSEAVKEENQEPSSTTGEQAEEDNLLAETDNYTAPPQEEDTVAETSEEPSSTTDNMTSQDQHDQGAGDDQD
eukprot:sb/3462511/